MPVEKETQAVAVGHLCLDVFHPNFERQMEVVEAIQPGTEYGDNLLN